MSKANPNARKLAMENSKTDIIECILRADKRGMLVALQDNPESINAIHEPSGMNAAMLAAAGQLASFVDALIEHSGHLLHFRHRTRRGHDFMEVALGTLDGPTTDAVQRAYERFAPHIINNWPEP